MLTNAMNLVMIERLNGVIRECTVQISDRIGGGLSMFAGTSAAIGPATC
jgi:hypothetical protein